jgi:glucose-1-phosphate cytidylyltransferase
MKLIILAGGYGTRISEETDSKPKPMITIGNKPMLEHIMNMYARFGFEDFVIAAGYRSESIFDWVKQFKTKYNIDVLDTGLDTHTGGRIKQCMNFIGKRRVFVTYGDGLGNVNITNLLEFHAVHGKLATVTAVRPPARFGQLTLEGNKVTEFGEKQHSDGGWINGGFFVLEPAVHDWVENDLDAFESITLPRLAKSDELRAFQHDGFWQPMDTLREKNELEKLWSTGNPPWMQ